jgi:hypothetical protein
MPPYEEMYREQQRQAEPVMPSYEQMYKEQ